jgi:hypothetical protein
VYGLSINQTISMNVGNDMCDCLMAGGGSETGGSLYGSECKSPGIILLLKFACASNCWIRLLKSCAGF